MSTANAGVAMGLVCAAATSTSLGAGLVVCCTRTRRRIGGTESEDAASRAAYTRARRRMLCASMAFAAGIMLLLAFTEIMEKAVSSLVKGYTAGAHNVSTAAWPGKTLEETVAAQAQNTAFLCFFLGVFIVYVLSALVRCATALSGGQVLVPVDGAAVESDVEEVKPPVLSPPPSTQPSESTAPDDPTHLLRVSLLMSLAIGLHNLPEGLATFVAGLDDPKVGGTLALAIAMHNIPEGICIAAPVVLGSGNAARAMGSPLSPVSPKSWVASSGLPLRLLYHRKTPSAPSSPSSPA